MSLFRASNAPADNHHDSSWTMPAYDGPTERLADPPGDGKTERKSASRAGRAGIFAAVAFSSVALVASAAAATMSWRTSREEPERAPVAGPVASPAPSAGGTAAIGEYQVSYAQEPLRMQVGCAAAMYIDLDEPRADAEPGRSDLRYDSRCGGKTRPTLSLGPGADGGSQVQDSGIDAAGCDRSIRTSPLGASAEVQANKGTVLCVLTSSRPPQTGPAQTAAPEGRARMVLVEVTDVAEDGTAELRATSWTVP